MISLWWESTRRSQGYRPDRKIEINIPKEDKNKRYKYCCQEIYVWDITGIELNLNEISFQGSVIKIAASLGSKSKVSNGTDFSAKRLRQHCGLGTIGPIYYRKGISLPIFVYGSLKLENLYRCCRNIFSLHIYLFSTIIIQNCLGFLEGSKVCCIWLLSSIGHPGGCSLDTVAIEFSLTGIRLAVFQGWSRFVNCFQQFTYFRNW